MAGDDEETTKFRSAGTKEEDGVRVLLLPGHVRAVEDVEEGVAVLLVLLAQLEDVHGAVSTTRSLLALSVDFREERKGAERRKEMAARGRKEGGELGFAGAARGSS